jgi:hypothetical protein
MRQHLMSWLQRWLPIALLLGHAGAALAQPLSHGGFVEGVVFAFPQDTPQDRVNVVADLLARDEVTVRPARWIRFAGGIDFRANTHDQVEDSWRIDFRDRGVERPRLSVRRLSATVARGPFTLEAGKQFVRWGKTDIVVPTDRFAARDFLTVVDAPFLAVTALRGTLQARSHTFDVVWVPEFTPSRMPLLDQRWVVLPSNIAPTASIVETPVDVPGGGQIGVRWGHVLDAFEYSVSFYDGFNHQPDIRIDAVDVTAGITFSRVYPNIRSYGADLAVPLRLLTVKGEAAYFTSPEATSDEYLLYVLQLERQSGEWVFVGGYAGEVVSERRVLLTFSPERGLSRAIVGRAAYTIDTNRRVEFEGAVRQDGNGVFARAEYSQARGQHWRATATAVFFGGDPDDFLGRYRRNSHVKLTVRYSF